VLPAEMTIYVAAELRGPGSLAGSRSRRRSRGEVDGQAVEEIDAAGLQCLLALARSLEAREQRLRSGSPASCCARPAPAAGRAHLLAPTAGVDA
jgi:hypothetical protein